MFAVFHNTGGRLEWISGAETEERARQLARMWSRYGNTQVLVVENGGNGHTEHLATYAQGRLLAAAAESLPLNVSAAAQTFPSAAQNH